MTSHREQLPFAQAAIVATFRHRDQAEEAVEVLTHSGLGTDQITLIPPDPDNEVLSEGGLIVAVEPCGYDDFVQMILRDHGVDEVLAAGSVLYGPAPSQEREPAAA